MVVSKGSWKQGRMEVGFRKIEVFVYCALALRPCESSRLPLYIISNFDSLYNSWLTYTWCGLCFKPGVLNFTIDIFSLSCALFT